MAQSVEACVLTANGEQLQAPLVGMHCEIGIGDRPLLTVSQTYPAGHIPGLLAQSPPQNEPDVPRLRQMLSVAGVLGLHSSLVRQGWHSVE